MKTNFHRNDLPIAYTMIAAAERIKPRRDGSHYFHKYFTLWTAFNNIYTTIANRAGLTPKIKQSADGTIVTYQNGSVKIPKVIPVREGKKIYLTLEYIDDVLKHKLIIHNSTKFFAERTPYWQGTAVEQDAFGQRLNGVININYTTSAQHPVWSPIDLPAYGRYLEAPEDDGDRELLSKQIVDLLNTVSNNLMYGGKKFDDGNDISVVRNAFPLLEMIITEFIR